MSARFSFEYEFTDDVALRATSAGPLNAKFLRALWPLLLAFLATGSVVALDRVLEWPAGLLDGVPEVLMILLGGMLALMILLQSLALLVMSRTRRQLLKWALNLRDRRIRWDFSDDSFGVHTSDSERRMTWSDVRRLRTGPEFWILGIKGGPDLLLPAVHLTDEIRELIRARTADLKKAGGRNDDDRDT